ncbi:hypothetical protein ACLOJK_033618 [Asimina triloba]
MVTLAVVSAEEEEEAINRPVAKVGHGEHVFRFVPNWNSWYRPATVLNACWLPFVAHDEIIKESAGEAMKGVSSAPGDYIHFKSQVPLHKISVGHLPLPLFIFEQFWNLGSSLLLLLEFGCNSVFLFSISFFLFLLPFCRSFTENPSVFIRRRSCGNWIGLVSRIVAGFQLGSRFASTENCKEDLVLVGRGVFLDGGLVTSVCSDCECLRIGMKQWRYYDFGPKVVPPLICLPGLAGSAEVYYKQIMSLSMKGYRVISVDIPHAWNHVEWIQAFEKFLDTIDVHHVHLYGTSLGGFLAQLFAQHRPRRVKSLVLSNTFLETRNFKAAMPWAPIVSWTPSFLLKRYILTGIHGGPHEPFIADSVDFVVCQVETLSRDDLASRLSLNVDAASVGSLLLSDSFITVMDEIIVLLLVVPFIKDCTVLQTNDYCAIPQQLKDQLSERYPGARRAYLKTGGDFPFLSRPDEVNLHLQNLSFCALALTTNASNESQLHLRRVGVEARPELVPGAPRDGSSGSPSQDKDGGDDDGRSKDGAGDGKDDDGHSKDGARDGSSAGPSNNKGGDVDDPSKDDSGSPSTDVREDNSTSAADSKSHNLDVIGMPLTLSRVVGHVVVIEKSCVFIATDTIFHKWALSVLSLLLPYMGRLVLYTSRKPLLIAQD